MSGCALDFDSIGFTGGGGAGGAGGEGTATPASGPSSASTEKGTSATMPGMCGVDQDCVPAPPTGWIGPGVWGPISDGCGFDQTPVLIAGESVEPTACPCEPSGFTCTGGVIDFFSAQLCSASSIVGDNVMYPPPGTCAFLGNYASGLMSADVIASPQVASGGSCVLAGGAEPSPTLNNPSNLCALTSQASCGSGFACAPAGSPACIAIEDPTMAGECPLETYPNVVARPRSATQVCDCTVGSPSGTCKSDLVLHKTSACNNAFATIDTSSSGCPTISVAQGDVYGELVVEQSPTCGDGNALLTDEKTWLVCCQ